MFQFKEEFCTFSSHQIKFFYLIDMVLTFIIAESNYEFHTYSIIYQSFSIDNSSKCSFISNGIHFGIREITWAMEASGRSSSPF